jgi:hypothetical protein
MQELLEPGTRRTFLRLSQASTAVGSLAAAPETESSLRRSCACAAVRAVLLPDEGPAGPRSPGWARRPTDERVHVDGYGRAVGARPAAGPGPDVAEQTHPEVIVDLLPQHRDLRKAIPDVDKGFLALSTVTSEQAADIIGVAIRMQGGPATIDGARAYAAINEFAAARDWAPPAPTRRG